MSIYASLPDIGMTEDGQLDNTVRSYGGSHLWPGNVEGRGWIGLASIPGFCVPGAPESAQYTDTVGEFLRMDIADKGDPISTTIVLTIEAATALRDQLTEWLTRPKEPTRA